MNKLEEKHLKAISESFWEDATTGAAAESCTTITIDFALKFNEWMDTSETANEYFKINRVRLEPKMDGSHNEKIKGARKELMEIFIKTL